MIDEKAKWEQEKKNLEEWVIKNRDIATDLQYQLDDAVKENEQLQKLIEQQAAQIKGLKYELENNYKDDIFNHLINLLVEEWAKNINPTNTQWDRLPEEDCPDRLFPATIIKGKASLRDLARQQLIEEGKIGPDAKPREGLYGKYCISKADGSPVDPNADYFVLRLDTDPVARRAAREYSYMTVDRKLALELQERITKYNPKMMDCINLQFFGVEKPQVWQITEERKAALNSILEYISYDSHDDIEICGHADILRAMLTEAA